VWVFYSVARYFAIFPLIVLEDRRIIEAFTRSSQLSKDRKGHVLLTLFLIFLIIWLFSLAIGVIALLAGNVAVTVVAQTLYTVVAYPLIGITQMILYYDARIRAEGFDIEVMAGSLGAPPVTGLT
jgi:membrane-anchored glycerophosphoryl diester phosphodiesterase (GDPDase)